MDTIERIEAFWAGERPDRIPYSIYWNEWRHTQDDPAWNAMFDKGLAITWHTTPFLEERNGVEVVEIEEIINGDTIKRQTLKTAVGEIYQTWKNGWHHEYFLKDENDYRVMAEIVRNTVLKPDYAAVTETINKLGPRGVPLLYIGRTPLQTMLVDFAGLEEFGVHLFEYEDEIEELYDALMVQFRQRVEIVAGSPGRYVANLENFTAESLGPMFYEKYLMPVYAECYPVLQNAGKVVGAHYDGRTACCKELIAKTPINVIESLTEPNEGDQLIGEARAAWPDKLFWCNIRVGDYELPPEKLRKKVISLVEAGAVDGRQFAFEVSEQYPANWKDSMPIVLDTLIDLGS